MKRFLKMYLCMILVFSFVFSPNLVQAIEPEAETVNEVQEDAEPESREQEDSAEEIEQDAEDVQEEQDVKQEETEQKQKPAAKTYEEDEKPVTPSFSQIKALDYRSIILKWKSTPDAEGYEIYRRSEKESEFKLISEITNDYWWGWPEEQEYEDTGLATGITYYYKIRTYCETWIWESDDWVYKKIYSDFSDEKSIKTKLKTTSLTLSNVNESSLNLKWKKVAGANGYKIERSTKSASGYKVVKTVSNGSTVTYKNSGLTLGTKYYYKVRAYRVVDGKNVYSDYSPNKSLQVKLKQAQITKFKPTAKGTMELTWKKVNKAQGYQIYRATKSNGTYKKVKTVKKGSTVKAKVTGQAHGKTYYYKVRAYTTVKNAKVYSPYSAIKNKPMGYYAYATEGYYERSQRIFGKNYYNGYTSRKKAEKNMKTVKVKVWNINSKGKKVTATRYITVHKKIAPTVKQIFKEIYQGKEKFPIKDVGGYSWRGRRSEHNEGLAIDINSNENYMIDNGKVLAGSFWNPKKSKYSIPPNGDVVKIMRKYGFEQGIWGNRKDYMHFSYFGT